MGSGASAIKDASKDRKSRFDLADESTLTDCFTARASWHRIQSQKVIPVGGGSISVFLDSAKIFRPFYQRLQSTTRSTLLQTSATFQSLFLDDLCSILLAGVSSFDEVKDFYNHYKSIPLREYGVIGETLIETLMEALPTPKLTGDLTPLAQDPKELGADFTARIRSDSCCTTASAEGDEWDDEGSWSCKPQDWDKPQDSSQSIVLAWVGLYGKFLRHLRAVMMGQLQPKAHPSMLVLVQMLRPQMKQGRGVGGQGYGQGGDAGICTLCKTRDRAMILIC
ncbi:hypothetical protein B484DRAFT_222159 [Ochromonadaceae sp. CCMP2298]|nr:hypothetical protein B484DRAFT_222159 [Ochromonadaceae sp. CCMP2298]